MGASAGKYSWKACGCSDASLNLTDKLRNLLQFSEMLDEIITVFFKIIKLKSSVSNC